MADKPQILDLMHAIRTVYPDASPADIKASLMNPEFLKAAHGPLPSYSTLSAPNLHNVKTAVVGSFIVCHGFDNSIRNPDSKSIGEPVVAIVKRGDKGPSGEDRYGVLGGFTNLGTETTAGESAKEGAVRELREEAVNDKGEPVISPDPQRLKLLVSDNDYRNAKLPTHYTGHSMELTQQELSLLKEHARKLQDDPAYKAAVVEKSGGEVADLKIMPLSEVVKMPRDSFTHPHEFDAVMLLADHLKQQQASLKRA